MRLVLLTLVVLLMQFPVILVPWAEVVFGRAVLFLADVPLAALTLVVAPAFWRDARAGRIGAATGCWAIVVALLAAAFPAHPSSGGAQVVLRALGAVAIAHAVARSEARQERILLAGALALTAISQAGIGVAQIVHGGPVGLTALGELSDPLHERATDLAPRGTMVATYALTALGLLAAARLAERALAAGPPGGWVALVAIAVSPVGFTYSRAAIVGLAAGLLSLVPGAMARRTAHAAVTVALILGVGVPAAVWSDGWLGRVQQTTAVRAPEAHDRQLLLVQAAGIVLDAPIAGVGPGRYVATVRERYPDDPQPMPVHTMPVLIAAESGVAAGIALVVLLAVTGWRAVRSGSAAVLVYAFVAPFVVFEQFLYTSAQGLALFGLWLGSLDNATSSVTSPERPPHADEDHVAKDDAGGQRAEQERRSDVVR